MALDLKSLLVQAIREVFVDATVILIAHRLDNVYGLDRVLMLDGGKASCLFCIVNPLRKISRSLGTQGNVLKCVGHQAYLRNRIRLILYERRKFSAVLLTIV